MVVAEASRTLPCVCVINVAAFNQIKCVYLCEHGGMVNATILLLDLAQQIANGARDRRTGKTDGLVTRGQRDRNNG